MVGIQKSYLTFSHSMIMHMKMNRCLSKWHLALGLLLIGWTAHTEESDYYQIDTFDTENLPMEVGAMTLLSDGNLLVGTRRGDVYVLDQPYGKPEEATFRPWARGLAQPLVFVYET